MRPIPTSHNWKPTSFRPRPSGPSEATPRQNRPTIASTRAEASMPPVDSSWTTLTISNPASSTAIESPTRRLPRTISPTSSMVPNAP